MPKKAGADGERGTIRRRGNTFQVRVRAGVDPVTGKELVLAGSASTEDETKDLRRRLLVQLADEMHARSTASFRAAMEKWLRIEDLDTRHSTGRHAMTDPTHHPLARTDWRNRSACQGTDAELFFPIATSGPSHHAQAARAKAMCAGCPVHSPLDHRPNPSFRGRHSHTCALESPYSREFRDNDGDEIVATDEGVKR